MRRLFAISLVVHLAAIGAAGAAVRRARRDMRGTTGTGWTNPWLAVDATTALNRAPTPPVAPPPHALAPSRPSAPPGSTPSTPTRVVDRGAHRSAATRPFTAFAPREPVAPGSTPPVTPSVAPPVAAMLPTVAARSPFDAASLFRTASTDAARIAASDPSAFASISTAARPTQGLFDRPPSARSGVRDVAQGYLQEVLAETNNIEPPGAHVYYRSLARTMRDTFRPAFYNTPDMVEALMAMPRIMAAQAQRFAMRASTYASTGRPDDPATPAIPMDFEERSTFSTRTTVSIVEVEQDDRGTVRAIRVVRHARVREFDDAALGAVRAALPTMDTVPLPGGRRVRFAFEVVASRDAIVPIAGFVFDETRGFFEMHYPGALHVRTRVRPMGSRPLGAPWPLPHVPHQ